MKQCTYCGKEFPDEALVCAIDGQPLRDVIPAPPPSRPLLFDEKRQVIDGEHIRLLSIFHFLVAGLALIGIAFLLLHYAVFSTFFNNPDLWKSQKSAPPIPKDFFKVFIWFYLFMGSILLIAGLLNLLSGIFLRQRRHRTFSLIVAGLNCVQVPFGTVLGVFTLVVLLRDSVREGYDGGKPPETW